MCAIIHFERVVRSHPVFRSVAYNNNNNHAALIKRELLVLPELGALYRKKEARTVQQQQEVNPSIDSTPADTA